MDQRKNSIRLISLDALRGFDMLWIIGGAGIVTALAGFFTPSLDGVAVQMHHVPWEGFRFMDLIFPLFVFISGISCAFSMNKHQRSGESNRKMMFKLVRRGLMLVFLGAVYNGLFNLNFVNQRWCSVLGLIGISVMLAGFIALYTRSFRALLFWALGILLFIAGIQFCVSLGDFSAGTFIKGKIINVWFDQFVPGSLNNGSWDPEGPLNMLSATVLPLLGCVVGRLILTRPAPKDQIGNVLILCGGGVSLILLAIGLSPWYPVIKCAWTGTFNLLTGGISMLLFALFYFLADVRGYLKWTFFFRMIGVNAIAVYLGTRFIDFGKTNQMLFGGIAGLSGSFSGVTLAVTLVGLEWVVLWFLWRHKIFFKV